MEDLEDYKKLILIKRDARELRSIIFGENETNDWDKLIILYMMILMYQHLYLVYQYMNIICHVQVSSIYCDVWWFVCSD